MIFSYLVSIYKTYAAYNIDLKNTTNDLLSDLRFHFIQLKVINRFAQKL